jgi:formate transporter
LGNLAGAIFVGFMLNAADVIGPAQGQRLTDLVAEKMRFEPMGAEGWVRVVASGVLANWLVGMAAFLATAARTVSGKILGILLPILAFVALGVQHVPANMGYFAAALIHGGVDTTVADAFVWNLLPATIGNLIGGAVLVALLFWYTYGGNAAGRGVLERASRLVHDHEPEAGR